MSCYGLPADFADAALVSIAARIRVRRCEADTTGGIRAHRCARALDRWITESPFVDRREALDDWYGASGYRVLLEAEAQFTATTGLQSADVWAELLARSGGDGLPGARRHFQHALMRRLRDATRPIAEDRMRTRLTRWGLMGPELCLGRRAARRLHSLRELTAPRVVTAALSSLWNRWCTARRFQRRGPCVLQCGCGDDSIEHYAFCGVVRRFSWSFLRLQWAPMDSLAHLLLLGSAQSDPTTLVLSAVRTYAVWRVTESARRSPPTPTSSLQRMLEQAAREAVRGHDRSAALVDGAWMAQQARI